MKSPIVAIEVAHALQVYGAALLFPEPGRACENVEEPQNLRKTVVNVVMPGLYMLIFQSHHLELYSCASCISLRLQLFNWRAVSLAAGVPQGSVAPTEGPGVDDAEMPPPQAASCEWGLGTAKVSVSLGLCLHT